MLEKIKRFRESEQFKTYSDVRVLGLYVFLALLLMVAWSGLGVIQQNYELQKKIAQLEQETAIAELETQNLKLKNKYFETDTFLELAARRQFGKGVPGEKVFIVPKAVAQAHTVDLTSPAKKPAAENDKPWYQRNLDAWFDFLLNRRS